MPITHTISTISLRLAAYVVGFLVLCPILALVWLSNTARYSDIALMNLGWYITNTVLLLLGVGVVSIGIGTISAWVITFYQFPGRSFLHWALLLPLSLPSYVAAYVYTDLLEYAGPMQSYIRHIGGYTNAKDYWFPSIRTLGGAILIMGLVLYPYVYLLARSSFSRQSPEFIHTARSLGLSTWHILLRIYLPMARPAIVAGAALAMMEAASDFGTVDYFAVSTLLRAVYDLWLTLGDVGAAARLALILTVTALFILAIEKYSRKQQRYTQTHSNTLTPIMLHGVFGWGACIICCIPVLLGFLLPIGRLMQHTVSNLTSTFTLQLLRNLQNSLLVACLAASVVLCVGLLVVYAQRWQSSQSITLVRHIANLGYATPGTVLAVGIIIVFAQADFALGEITQWINVPTITLSGSLFALILTLTIRFLAISSGTLEAGLNAISPTMDMAAQSLGYTPRQTAQKFHLPLIKNSMMCAVLLVFVDAMKELPATLILRPFNFDTLATSMYFYAADEQIPLAATGALLLVIPCAIAMCIVHWLRQHNNEETHTVTLQSARETYGNKLTSKKFMR